MKKGFLGIIILASCVMSALIFHEEATQAQGTKGKKKLYISSVKAEGAPAPMAARVRDGVKLAIFEGWGDAYQILDDDAVKVMYKQAEAIMSSGCSDTICVTQIAEGINADEIIYGSVSLEGGKLKLSLTNLERNKETLELGTKSIASVTCNESELDHYAGEMGRKLMNKGYLVKKASLAPEGKISLNAIETEKIAEIKGVKGIEGLGIAVLKFTTPDESIQNILTILKNYVKDGDKEFQAGRYGDAVAKYNSVFDSIKNDIRKESRQKLDEFSGEVKKRVEATYAMNYKTRVDKADPLLKSGDYKGARSKFNDILEDLEVSVPQEYAAAVGSIGKGLRDRLDATWAAQFKKDIEKADARLQGKESADEPFLKDMLERYGDIEGDFKEVPQKSWGEGMDGIRKAVAGRKDSVTIAAMALWHKKGDTLYKDFKFDEAKGCYDKALAWSEKILDGTKRGEYVKGSGDKLEVCFTTGKNFITSKVKSFVDRAEVYNVEKKKSDAKSMMKDAYRLMNGPMHIFATVDAVNAYNSMAEVLGMDALTQGDEPKLFGAINAEKARIEEQQRKLAAIEAQEMFKKLGGKSKITGGIDFVFIPGGSFIMGGDGFTPHKVTVSSFWISKYEVTQDQYQAIMGKNPSNWKGGNLPVEQVSWNDAKSFCQSFSAKYGGTVRLPTEAEWEYACRAGTTTKYYWGDSVDGAYCWYGGNAGSKTQPVGGKLPNAWGLYDMSGNVYEWCEDWYGDYSSMDQFNPMGPSSGSYRVLRGGSWGVSGAYIRSAFRDGYDPDDGLIYLSGFRVVVSGGN